MKTASPQDTFDHMLGSGATDLSWWKTYNAIQGVKPTLGEVEDNWIVRLGIEDPENELAIKVADVSHAAVLKAACLILSHKPGEGPTELRYVSEDCRIACKALVFDADDCDFDAFTADELLQLIVLGEVVYG